MSPVVYDSLFFLLTATADKGQTGQANERERREVQCVDAMAEYRKREGQEREPVNDP